MVTPSVDAVVRPGARAAVAAAAALLWASGPALAVVGGAEETGPLSRQAVMVLNARGGMCSAVVVASNAVLTAGHCAAGGGPHRVHYRGPGGAPVLLEPAAVAVHPGYDAGAVAGRRRSIDLALVRLADPLPDPFGPARLSTEKPGAGAPVTLGGYGVAREGDARSTGTFRTAALTAVEPYGPGKVLLWASDPRRAGAGACQGDSGGPILGQDGAVAAVSGWAAGGAGRGCGAMSQGVLLAPQRAWIDATLARWGLAASWR